MISQMMQNGIYGIIRLQESCSSLLPINVFINNRKKKIKIDIDSMLFVSLKLIEMLSEVYWRLTPTVLRKKQTIVGLFFFHELLLSHKYLRNQINSTMIRIKNGPHKSQHKTTRQTRPNKKPPQNLKENISSPSTPKTRTTKLAKQGLETRGRDESM